MLNSDGLSFKYMKTAIDSEIILCTYDTLKGTEVRMNVHFKHVFEWL